MTRHELSFGSRINSTRLLCDVCKLSDIYCCLHSVAHVAFRTADSVITDISNASLTRPEKRKGGQHKVAVKSKEWIVNKKATRRKQGKTVKGDSKYTGRKRHAAF